MMPHNSFRFGSFTLDLERLCLRGPSGPTELRRKSFEVLRYLVEHAGRVVTKEEVIKAVWPNVLVGDEALTKCISEVRRAIGDESQRIIKTVPRRGYLMDVLVSESGVISVQAPMATKATPPLEALPRTPALTDRPSIAVLAFANLSGDPHQEYFSDGVTEDITTELSRFSELFVIARNSSFQYKGKSVDVRQVGRQLGVRYVLEGSIQRHCDRIRISAQLVDAVTGAHRWADRYDRNLKDVFAVQDEVARTIAALLAAHVQKAEVERALLKPPAIWRAYDCYMRAVGIFASFWSSFEVERLYEARRLLEHCLSLDPVYARAHVTLSHTYTVAWTQRMDGDYLMPATLARAYELARRAVQLDPNLPQAHAQLGIVLTWKRQPDASLAEFEKAMSLNASFSDWRLIGALIFAGEPARAIDAGKAHMQLDPLYLPLVPGWLGFAYYMLRRYPEAQLHLQECVLRSPNYRTAHQWLAATYARLGQLQEAQAEAAEVLRIDPKYTIDGHARTTNVFRLPEDAAHYFDGLRKAGLPEN